MLFLVVLIDRKRAGSPQFSIVILAHSFPTDLLWT